MNKTLRISLTQHGYYEATAGTGRICCTFAVLGGQSSEYTGFVGQSPIAQLTMQGCDLKHPGFPGRDSLIEDISVLSQHQQSASSSRG